MIWILLLSVLILFFNLRDYATLLKGDQGLYELSEKYKTDIKSVLAQTGMDIKLFNKIIIIIGFIIILPWFLFYIAALSMLISYPIFIGWSVVQLLFTIRAYISFVSVSTKSDYVPKINVAQKICHPLNTIFIIYFIYFLMTNI